LTSTHLLPDVEGEMVGILLGVPRDIVQVELLDIAMLKVFCISVRCLAGLYHWYSAVKLRVLKVINSLVRALTREADPIIRIMRLLSARSDEIPPFGVERQHLLDER
jgi:hypothetical protein